MVFRARFIANIIQYASQQGVDRRKLLAILDKELEELNDESLTFDTGTYNQVMELATELSRDPSIGLHFGEYQSLSAAGLTLQIVQSSRTVEEALYYIVEFANLGCQALPFRLEEQAEEWEMSLHPNAAWLAQSPVAVRQTMDGMVVFTLREFHTLTRRRFYPRRIHFFYPRPENFREYERIFQCPIRYDQPYTALYLDKKHVSEPVITSDYTLLQMLVQYAEKKLSSLQEESGFAQIVRQSIINMVKPQFPTIEQVAANLNLSVRSLQRRLSEEDLTFSTVLEELKRQFALDYLQNERLSIKEIAYLLDYADASSFIRSFRRWMGVSPEQYRLDGVR
jgi:AraC-like DNA-binding protein